jgi:hypothetical protein
LLTDVMPVDEADPGNPHRCLDPDQASELELKFRNVPEASVKVYRIDLMKFTLLRRNLGGITRISTTAHTSTQATM